MASGAVLALLGLARRDNLGLLIAGVGGGLIYRGATGHCSMYSALNIDTAEGTQTQEQTTVHIAQSMLIDKPPEELYRFWRNLDNLPRILSHVENVRTEGDGSRRSHWTVKLSGVPMRLEWDAEITADQPNERIGWRALPGATIQHSGEVQFRKALGDRGTIVRAIFDIIPPLGGIGRFAARQFMPALDQQIRTDLGHFKALMETGEIPTIQGQPRGTCLKSGGKREGE